MPNSRLTKWWLAGPAAYVLSHAAGAGTVLHVDDDAPLGGDGLAWNTAYRFLQDALATAGAGTEVRVAQGTYLPDLDEAGGVTPGDREAAFALAGDVGVLGGWRGAFDGSGMPADDRDIANFVTILSADLLGDDGPDFANNDENGFHVLTADMTAGTAVLDVVTISGGTADNTNDDTQRYGGGLFSPAGNIAITSCTFDGNTAVTRGGGLWVIESAQLAHCTFTGNTSYIGGAMAVGGIVTASDCTFVDNCVGGAVRISGMLTALRCDFVGNSTGDNATPVGGGVSCYGDALFVACRFSHNTASNRGGGIYLSVGEVTLVNCLLNDNDSGGPGGGAAFWSSATLYNCTFSQNTAGSSGGGVFITSATVEMTNCILWANTATFDEQIRPWDTQPPFVSYCDIQGGWPGLGNIDADPLFVDPAGGDFRLSVGSLCLEAGTCIGLPADELDLDGDGNFDEPLPHDFDGEQRRVNTAVDIGSYELQSPPIGPGDLDRDSIVGISDFLLLLAGWGSCCRGDLNIDGRINGDDLDLLLAVLGPCPKVGSCPADLNNDGEINPDDVLLLAGGYGGCAPCSDAPGAILSNLARTCHADIDQDGVTGITDFLILLANWN